MNKFIEDKIKIIRLNIKILENTLVKKEDEKLRQKLKKEYSELTKEDKHEMDCFGSFGMAEWCRDNIKNMQ